MQNEDDQPKKLAAAVDQGEIDAAFIAIRAFADATVYGKAIADSECRALAIQVVTAIENYRAGTSI